MKRYVVVVRVGRRGQFEKITSVQAKNGADALRLAGPQAMRAWLPPQNS